MFFLWEKFYLEKLNKKIKIQKNNKKLIKNK